MKITKSRLEQIVKEELENILSERGFGEGEPAKDELSKKRVVYLEEEGEVEEGKKKDGRKGKAESEAQQQAAGIAYAAKKGEIPVSKLKGASKQMYKMTKKQLKHKASTKHKGLPKKKT